MILFWIVIIPFIGAVLSWFSAAKHPLSARWIAIVALGIDLILALSLAKNMMGPPHPQSTASLWAAEISWDWIPQAGLHFHLAIDGLSMVLVLLTLILGIAAVVASWSEIKDRLGFFLFNLLAILSGILGVFLAMDLILFYFCWELMLIPMYFLIAIWGHENRRYAAMKFFIFTQAGSLFLLLAILGLYFLHGHFSGNYSFEYQDLLNTPNQWPYSLLFMLGFLIAFAVKLPIFPFHPWLPDAHTEAPTGGSIILAGLLLKTGAYGMLRFVLPFFPQDVQLMAPLIFVLAAIGIIYGAIMAFAQSDLKKLVAFSSVSHMGFVLLGIFAGNEIALNGALLQIVCHGISTGALFFLVGALQERLHTRDLNSMGGLWPVIPRLSALTLFFALASLGLPGLGNFLAEFLVLLGSYIVTPIITIIASIGLVYAAVYSLRIVQQAFHGKPKGTPMISDLYNREAIILGLLILIILFLGVYPQPVMNLVAPTLQQIRIKPVDATSPLEPAIIVKRDVLVIKDHS